MPILVFLGLSVLDLGPMYATDRQTDVRQHHRLMPPPIMGGDIIMHLYRNSVYAATVEILIFLCTERVIR